MSFSNTFPVSVTPGRIKYFFFFVMDTEFFLFETNKTFYFLWIIKLVLVLLICSTLNSYDYMCLYLMVFQSFFGQDAGYGLRY